MIDKLVVLKDNINSVYDPNYRALSEISKNTLELKQLKIKSHFNFVIDDDHISKWNTKGKKQETEGHQGTGNTPFIILEEKSAIR
jgi:hypothetical protein